MTSLPKRAYRRARRSYTQAKAEYPVFDKLVGAPVNRAKKTVRSRLPAKPRRVPKLSPIQRSEEVDVMVMSLVRGLEPMHQGLIDLITQLQHKGVRAKLICREGDAFDTAQAALGDAVIDSPFSVLMAGRGLPSAPEAASLPDDDQIDEIVLEDRGFRKKDLSEPIAEWERKFVRQFYNYWNAYLRRSQVKVLLTWGDTSTISRLLIRIAKDINAEHYVLERANFPGTLYLDPLGQYGNGLRQKTLAKQLWEDAPADDRTQARFTEISQWYWGLPEIVHSSEAGQEELNDLRRLKESGRKIITVFGGNDYGSGVRVPRNHRLSWVQSSRSVFDYVHSVVTAKFPDAYVVYRPHPSDRDYPEADAHSQLALEANIHQLIELSDVCINVSTTTHAVALLQEKPSITVGPTDALGYGRLNTMVDKTLLLPYLREILWEESAGTEDNRKIIVDYFDHWLVGAVENVPARLTTEHIGRLLFDRIRTWRSKYALAMPYRERGISAVMAHAVMARQRQVFTNEDPQGTHYNGITVVVPVYGDYSGTRRCIEQAIAHQELNGYRIIIVWDRGPDLSLRELCREFKDHRNVTVIENVENVGFSGSVNSAIVKAGDDDVVLLNSDAVVATDWALRLQRAAYADPKLATVVPFSNNATAWNVPFPDGQQLPAENTVEWVQRFDDRAKTNGDAAVEMPTNHGFCIFIKRSIIERIGLFDELKFGIGQSEDNDFAMRLRANGYFTGCAVNTFVGHDGSTSFADLADEWRAHGREVLTGEYTHYIKEVRHFYASDPLAGYRETVLGDEMPEQAWPEDDAPEEPMMQSADIEEEIDAESEANLEDQVLEYQAPTEETAESRP